MHGGSGFGRISSYKTLDKSQKIPLRKVPWKRIWSYFRPYKVPLISVIFVIALAAIFGTLQPVLMRQIVDNALLKHNYPLLDKLTVWIIGLIVASSLLGVLQTYINSWIGEAVMNDLRVKLYAHLQRMPVDFFTKTKTGEVMSRMTNDVQQLQSVVTQTYGQTLNNLLVVVTTTIAMLEMNLELAVVSLAILPIFILPLRQVGKITYRVRRDTQAKIGEMSSHMAETLSLSGALLIKLFGRQQQEVEHFTGISQEIRALDIKQTLVGRWFFMFLSIITASGPAIIYFVGGHPFFGRTVSIGTMVAFTVFLTRLLQPVSSLANTGVNVYSSVALFDRLFEYLDLTPSIEDAAEPVDLPEVRGHVQFHDVCFSYGGDRLALDHVQLEAKPGQMIALVGPSGAGKSTISYLVARLYDPSAGSVTLDGIDLKNIRLSSLSAAMGMVTQDTFLFHDTILANLRFAKPDATDDEVVAATKAAAIHDLIVSLPEGYNTVVGERGHKLSGGEKQRMSIARVLLKNPRVVVLDEATSALDSASERAVQDALAALLTGRTAIVIAHRLSTVLEADCIYVVEQGQIREHGTHAELLETGGLYQRLFHEQFARALEDVRVVG
ncbi:MAG: ABC transporter ATP-binding protein [Alicyclobacillaceae bacterium]|jgi:ATP-binding cassette subfamily B protein|nr:ABC transporter ATP-binding protein [Alicyclobacillaceae bacterium]